MEWVEGFLAYELIYVAGLLHGYVINQVCWTGGLTIPIITYFPTDLYPLSTLSSRRIKIIILQGLDF